MDYGRNPLFLKRFGPQKVAYHKIKQGPHGKMRDSCTGAILIFFGAGRGLQVSLVFLGREVALTSTGLAARPLEGGFEQQQQPGGAGLAPFLPWVGGWGLSCSLQSAVLTL